MQNNKKYQAWFASIVGFFYQHGIGCDIDRNMALELYLQSVNNENSLNNNLNQLYLIEENGNQDNKLQDINIIIGKYLLSLFYYLDIILAKKYLDKKESINKSNNKFDAEINWTGGGLL